MTEEADSGPLLSLEGVSKVYGAGDAQVHALRKVDLTIQRGEFVAIMGPSGSGKSTCLNLLGCLDRPSSGTYRFRGVQVEGLDPDRLALLRRSYFGFIFQNYHLLPRTRADENVELPLIYRGIDRSERVQRVGWALDRVGLSNRAKHTPEELSGGQQQRVAIARAIVSHPSLLLADEPTGNLDSERKSEIMNLLSELNQSLRITIAMVTHEPEMAAFSSRVVTFRDGLVASDLPNCAGGSSVV